MRAVVYTHHDKPTDTIANACHTEIERNISDTATDRPGDFEVLRAACQAALRRCQLVCRGSTAYRTSRGRERLQHATSSRLLRPEALAHCVKQNNDN